MPPRPDEPHLPRLPRQARYERGAARVFRPDGAVVGAGFLLAPELVCTCAHVVAEPDGGPPGRPVTVDFPLLAGADAGAPVPAEVEFWRPEDDIAVLRLATPADGTEPLPLADGTEGEWGGEIRAFGFPEGVPRGVNATGVLRGRQRLDRLQLDLAAHGAPIGRGFSGAAVWDVAHQAVVGMLVTRGRADIEDIADTAYLIPADRLIGPDMPLDCPFRGLGRFEEADSRYFHGREEDVEELVTALGSRPVTVLVGPSGSGKSSLLRAGLLAGLRSRGTPAAVRVPRPAEAADAPHEHADAWVAEAVTAAWQSAAPDTTARDDRLDAVRRACTGQDAERTALRGRLSDELGRSGSVLLLDQFEEYAAASPHGALRAFRVLSALAQAPDPAQGGGLRVVLTARPATLEALTAADTSAALGRAVTFLAPMTAEALTRAVEEPVRAVPGLRIEDGLTRRLVDDAVGEPGCLPLLQFALTQLWDRRAANTLTHGAYEEIGGVGGALAAYADDALDRCLAESGTPEDAARRLFQQLARPDGEGGFTRRAVPTRQLPPPQAVLARDLAGRRLLVWDVVDGAADGGTVHVVHEALLREWPRLARWLHEGAEFREWQDRTARDATEWEARGRPVGLLPHGVRLAQGLEWLGTRREDLTDLERTYLEAGRRRQRRGLRRLWGVVGLVTALAVVASVLAVNTYRARQQDLRELRTAAATELSELSGEVADRSPDSAFRYAAGAWSAQHTTQAQQALLAQYTRARDVVSSHRGLWQGAAQLVLATPDGRTLVVVSQPDGKASLEMTAVTGVLDGRPRAVRPEGFPDDLVVGELRHAVSDDGRYYAASTADGRVLVWDLTAPRPAPKRLSGALAERGTVYEVSLDFSDDGGRLLHFFHFERSRPEDADRRGLARLWNVADGRSLPLSQRTMSRAEPSDAWLLGEGDRIAVASSRQVGDGDGHGVEDSLDIYATGSGDRVRRVYGPVATEAEYPTDQGRGIWLSREGGTRWYSLVPGARRPSGTLTGNVDTPDLTGTHFLSEQGMTPASAGAYRRVTVLDARYGNRYWTAVVPGKEMSEPIAVTGTGSGPRTLVTVVGDSLLRARAVPVPTPLQEETDDDHLATVDALAVAPDDDGRVARLRQGRLEVVEHGTRVRGAPVPERYLRGLEGELNVLWVAREGGDALLVWSHDVIGALLYDIDDLHDPLVVTWDCGREGGSEWDPPRDIVQTPDGHLVLLCLGASLLRLDPHTGMPIGDPVHLVPAPQQPGMFSDSGQLVPRPGHRGQVAVITAQWRSRGRIEVWDVRRGERTARLEGAPLRYDGRKSVAFTPDGSRLAALGDDERAAWWWVDEEHRYDLTRGLAGATGLLGVADNGTLVVSFRFADAIGLLPPGGADVSESLGLSEYSSVSAWRLNGDTLRLLGPEDDLTVHLSPDHWHRTLCAALDDGDDTLEEHGEHDYLELDRARQTRPCPAGQ
ncbi:trypsin-like peptidase domain-containing protein [Streptomyces sp. CRN 30]|uniref:nSTAND1 domain-containing NTPase n=1 Tax=Streptomyces sp. CRN 30 TaxID=3075613 RepID=UPI002A80C924|nr:trypsin-like peptidase domain-containing protein [Streptomyces sp. CRN 30]